MKFVVLILTFIFSHSAVAQDPGITLTMSRSNKLGVKLSDQLRQENGKIFVNGLEVPKALAADALKVFDLFRHFNPPKKKICAAGNFVLKIEEGGKKSEVKGCAEGKDYGWIMSRLHALKQKISK